MKWFFAILFGLFLTAMVTAVTHRTAYTPADPPAPVVMLTEVYVCGKYRGAFLVTADGHWLYEDRHDWSEKNANIAAGKLPKYAQAYLEAADASEGDCPPKVSINLEVP